MKTLESIVPPQDQKRGGVVRMSKQNTCPECGYKVTLRMGKYGEFIGCSQYPKCKWSTSWIEWDIANCDPDRWKFDKLMREAEAEATNPNN